MASQLAPGEGGPFPPGPPPNPPRVVTETDRTLAHRPSLAGQWLWLPEKPPLPARAAVEGGSPDPLPPHPSHLLVTVLLGPFPSLLFLIHLLLLLLWEDVVNPGQVMLGEDEVQKPSHDDEAQDLR